MDMVIRCGVLFKNDGLDLEGVKEDLSKYGTIFDVQEIELDEDTPCTLIFLEQSFANHFKLKLDFNCATAPDNRYILLPMASIQDKLKVDGAL